MSNDEKQLEAALQGPGLVKVALIRDASTPIGQPGKMHLNCPCGAKPEVDATEVLCVCGRRYSPTGWLIEAPKCERCGRETSHCTKYRLCPDCAGNGWE